MQDLESRLRPTTFLIKQKKVHREKQTDFSPQAPKINYNNSNNDYTVKQRGKKKYNFKIMYILYL